MKSAFSNVNADVANTLQEMTQKWEAGFEAGITSNPNYHPPFFQKPLRLMTAYERAYVCGYALVLREAMDPRWAREIDQEALIAIEQAREQEVCSIL